MLTLSGIFLKFYKLDNVFLTIMNTFPKFPLPNFCTTLNEEFIIKEPFSNSYFDVLFIIDLGIFKNINIYYKISFYLI